MRLFVLILGFVVGLVLSSNPGARLLVTQSFLDYGKQIGIQVLNKEIKGLHIPDVSGSAKTNVKFDDDPKSLLHYNLKNIAITAFSASASHATVALSPPSTASFAASQLTAAVHLDYHITVGSGWFSVSKSGNIDARASSTSFSLGIALSQANSRPHLTPRSCSANIGRLDITFHGDVIDSVLNLFKDTIANYLKGKLSGILCDQVSKLISDKANGVLAGIPISIGITDGFNIDYSLTENPAVVSNGAYIDLLGRIWFTGHHADNGIPNATPFPSTSCTSMFCVVLDGEEVLGSLGYAAQTSGILHFSLDKSVLAGLPGGLDHYLDCTCSNGACIGALIPEIASKCAAGSAVTINMASTMAPTAHVNTTGAFVNFEGDLNFVSVTPAGAQTPLFIAHIILKAGIPSNLNFHGWTISGEVHVVDAQLTVTSSQVGSIDEAGLNELWQLAMLVVIEGQLNQITSAGINLPAIPYFTVNNPNLAFGEHVLKLDAGLTYNGPIKSKQLSLADIINK